MSIEKPTVTNSKEGHKEIEISLVKPEDATGIAEVGYKAQRAMHEREHLLHPEIPTPEDIDADHAQDLEPENLKKREQAWKELPENPNERYFVARVDGKVVGYCLVAKHEDRNQIESIYIDPDFQGKGLGKRFWNETLQFFDPEKESVVYVLPYNSQAISYYQSLGFEETGGKAHEGEGTIMESGAVMPIPEEMVRKADKSIEKF